MAADCLWGVNVSLSLGALSGESRLADDRLWSRRHSQPAWSLPDALSTGWTASRFAELEEEEM